MCQRPVAAHARAIDAVEPTRDAAARPPVRAAGDSRDAGRWRRPTASEIIDYPLVHEDGEAAAAAIARGCATRARSSRSSCRSVILRPRSRSRCRASTSTSCPDSSPGQPVVAAGRVRHLLPGLPAARLPLGAAAARRRRRRSASRDSTEIIFISWLVNCLVPAKLGDVYRAYLLQAQLRRLAAARPSARSSSSASSTCSRSCSWASPPASGASATACRREVQLVFAIGLVVIAVLAVGLFLRAQLRPPASCAGCRCRIASSSSTTASRRASSRSSARQLPVAGDRHRADLGDRGAAPLLRRRWRWASPMSTWASAAPSSWPSSRRC